MQIRQLILLTAICILTTCLSAQSDLKPCGTHDHRSSWLQHYQRHADQYDKRGGEILYVPLSIFIVSNDDGQGEITPLSLMGSLCTLNDDFADSNIQFYIQGGFKYLSRNEMYNHSSTTDAAFQMFDLNIPNTINCYIVGTAAGNCGYNLPYAGVVLDISCTTPEDHTWAHEIGHNLSLPHPFLGWEGGHGYDGPPVGSSSSTVTFIDPAPETVLYDYTLFQDTLILDTLIIDTAFVEKVDGSNCMFAADGFCDTPPDYLAFRWNCTPSGTSIGFQTDPDGVQFKSDATLIMSYANDDCANRFTDEQINAMRANLIDEKPELLSNPLPGPTIEDPTVSYLYPSGGEVAPFDYVEMEWEPVENATLYWVKVAIDPGLGFVVWESIVSEPNAIAEVGAEYADRTAYWSVAPFTDYEFCVDFQGSSEFYLSDVSSVVDITHRPWDLVPSVIAAGESINIDSTEDLYGATISVHAIDGSQILQATLRSEIMEIPQNWKSGIYIVSIQLGSVLHHQKLVVR